MKTPHRTPAVGFDDIPGELPRASIPDNCDIADVGRLTIEKLNRSEIDDFTDQALWRDFLSLTGTYRTFHSRKTVFETLQSLEGEKGCSSFRLHGSDPREGPGWLDVDFAFDTNQSSLKACGCGTASVIICPDGVWRIWMLRTWLEHFEGHGHPDQPITCINGTTTNAHSSAELPSENDVYGAVIVGGGQAGLGVAGRLQALGIKYLLVEKTDSIGDVWRNRYESLRWHTITEYGHLPFGRTFSPEEDCMLPAHRIGAGYQLWAEKHNINMWTRTEVLSATYAEETRQWTVSTISKDGKHRIVIATNLVLCVGPGSNTPVRPSWASEEAVKASGFKGTVVHGNRYRSCHTWAGQHGVVVGTANTGHDIAEDMANAGMSTTILQRGRTFVMPAAWLHQAEEQVYHVGKPVGEADREQITLPNKITRELTNRGVRAGMEANADFFHRLEKAGFKVDWVGDIYTYLYVRFGGHYVDIGCSERIIRGEIKVKGTPVKTLTRDGLLFEDGSELPADLIVLATGFEHDFRVDAARIVGPEVAEQMDDYFGLSAEGEIRGHARIAGHPRLYNHGGDIRMARWFSRFIALQIQADLLGQPLEPYLE